MAGIKDFKKVANTSEDTAKLQERLQEYLQPITKCPLIDGVLLTDLVLPAGTNTISHKLGRKLIGWIVVRNQANSVLWDGQNGNSLPEKTLIISCSAPTTIDLWVF